MWNGLIEELRKWSRAASDTFRKSQSGKWLWILCAICMILLAASSFTYQWAGAELNKPKPTKIIGTIGTLDAKDGAKSNVVSATTQPDETPATTLLAFSSTLYGFVSSFSLASLTVSGSLLAAFAVSLLAKFQKEIQLLDQTQAIQALANSQSGISKGLKLRIAVVVPSYRFEPPPLPATRLADTRVLHIEVGGKPRKWKLPLTFSNRCDSQAAHSIRTKLLDLGFERVDILDDTESASTFTAYDCEIHIGLRVNARLNAILDSTKPPTLFSIPELPNGHFGLCLSQTNSDGEVETESSTVHRVWADTSEIQYMLLAKHTILGKSTFVVAGLSDTATLKCAEYFCAATNRVVEFRDQSSKLQVDRKDFAAVLSYNTKTKRGVSMQETRVLASAA